MGAPPITAHPGEPGGATAAPHQGIEVSPSQGGARIAFLRKGVQPPSNLYILQDDQLAVTLYNSIAGVEVDVSGRLLEPDGRIVPFFQQIFPPADSAGHITLIGLAEGFLLNVVATSPTSGLLRGQCFAELSIARGSAAALTSVAILAADYVYARGFAGWPNGRVVSSVDGPGVTTFFPLGTGTTLAGVITTVPAGQVWRLRIVNFGIVTGSATGNRQAAVTLSSGGETFWTASASALIPASTDAGAYFTEGIGYEQANPAVTSILFGLPDVRLYNPATIQNHLAGFQAGDEVSGGVIVYDQWIAG